MSRPRKKSWILSWRNKKYHWKILRAVLDIFRSYLHLKRLYNCLNHPIYIQFATQWKLKPCWENRQQILYSFKDCIGWWNYDTEFFTAKKVIMKVRKKAYFKDSQGMWLGWPLLEMSRRVGMRRDLFPWRSVIAVTRRRLGILTLCSVLFLWSTKISCVLSSGRSNQIVKVEIVKNSHAKEIKIRHYHREKCHLYIMDLHFSISTNIYFIKRGWKRDSKRRIYPAIRFSFRCILASLLNLKVKVNYLSN